MMKKIISSVTILLISALFLAGCADTTPPLPTKTGKPDITIQADKEAVFNSLTDELITAGYMLKSVNETKDIAVYVIQHQKMMIVWEEMPVDELATINLVNTSSGVRLLGSISYIGYPGTNMQRVVSGPGFVESETKARDNLKLYNIFLQVKSVLEKK